jgi:regulatory protein
MTRPPSSPSLKVRAIGLLAQREHSALELRRKLMRIALAQAEAEADTAGSDPAAQVDELLAWLQSQGYLDEARFVESRLHARATRHGNLRIRQELAQHGLSLTPEQQAGLKDSELGRAREIWQRKFGAPAADAAGRAKQMRFLAGRGFSAEVIRRLLRQGGGGAEDD